MYEFKVRFRDGNERIFSAKNIYDAMQYVFFVLHYDTEDVIKVEEI